MEDHNNSMLVSRSESSLSLVSNQTNEPLHKRMSSGVSLDDSIEILEEGANSHHGGDSDTKIQTTTINGQRRIVSKQQQEKKHLPHEPGMFSTFVDSFLEYVEDVFGLGGDANNNNGEHQTHDPTVDAKANFSSFIN